MFIKKFLTWHISQIVGNLVYTGRIQSLLRESVKFFNFGKLLWSCDSPFKVSPMLKIWALLAQRAMIYWSKCSSTSLREKYLKKIKKKSKTDKCIGISIKKYPEGFLISQIRHKIQVENACWNSVFLKSRNHTI